MAESTAHAQELSKLMESWLKTTTSFWKDIGAAQPEQTTSESKTTTNTDTQNREEKESDKFRTYQTWETGFNNMVSLMKILTTPENQETISKSSNAFMDAAVQASSDSLENIAEFHASLVEGLAKIADHTKAYNLDDLDHDAFESFRNLYRSEIQKYLNIPKVGLPRQFHEQLSQLVDRSNIYYSHLVELIFLFLLPFEKTNRRMQKKTSQMLERGEFINDSKQAYKEWIQMLEESYMDLLNSPEYTNVLNNTISSLAEYKSIKNEIIAFFLKDLQVPTNKEMDEVYKDLYHTKKKVNSLTRETDSLKRELQDLKTDMKILMKELANSRQEEENVTP